MLITCVLHIWPEGHREPRNEVGSLSPAERIEGFEPGAFRFWSQCLNPLGHFPHAVPYAVIPKKSCIPCLDLGEGMFFITFDYLEKSPFLIFCVPRILVRLVQKRTCPCLVSYFWTLFKTCSVRSLVGIGSIPICLYCLGYSSPPHKHMLYPQYIAKNFIYRQYVSHNESEVWQKLLKIREDLTTTRLLLLVDNHC